MKVNDVMIARTRFCPFKYPKKLIRDIFEGKFKMPIEEVTPYPTHNFTFRVYSKPPAFLKISNPKRDVYNHFPEKGFGILMFLHKSGLNVPTPYYFFRVQTEKRTFSGYFAEWIEGINLYKFIYDYSKVPQKELIERIEHIAKGIGSLVGKLHNLGLTHGDLALRNIIVTPKNDVYIVDFDYSIPIMFAFRNYDLFSIIREVELGLYVIRDMKRGIVEHILELVEETYNKETSLLKRTKAKLKIIKGLFRPDIPPLL